MTFQIDESLHWTDHYVEHGMARIKNALPSSCCDTAVAAIQKALGTDLPPSQWACPPLEPNAPERLRTVSVFEHQEREDHGQPELQAVLDTIYDQPEIRDIIDTMFGSPDHWDGSRPYQLFIRLFDPNAKQVLSEPHVDFVNVRIPVIGNWFYFQVSLVKTEPFSGNISIYPGLHKIVQKRLIEQPNWWYGSSPKQKQEWNEMIAGIEPFEFVADPGDVLLFSHLAGHAGNASAATGRSPRVAMQCQAIRKDWPSKIDATDPNLTPWQRSLAHNGSIDLGCDEGKLQADAYRQRQDREAAAKA